MLRIGEAVSFVKNKESAMPAALRAGAIYFAIAFAAGFALGAIRVLVVVPQVGETAAVLIELPVILVLSWFACAWLVGRFAVPARSVDRLVMGVVAFLLLMAGEVGVSVFAFGRTLAEHAQTYQAAGAQLGLAGQIVFAALPLVQMAGRRA